MSFGGFLIRVVIGTATLWFFAAVVYAACKVMGVEAFVGALQGGTEMVGVRIAAVGLLVALAEIARGRYEQSIVPFIGAILCTGLVIW